MKNITDIILSLIFTTLRIPVRYNVLKRGDGLWDVKRKRFFRWHTAVRFSTWKEVEAYITDGKELKLYEEEIDNDPFGVNDLPGNVVDLDYTYCDLCGWKLDFDCTCRNKNCKRFISNEDKL